MADFVAVLTKTIDGLGDRNTADMRKRVYEKARKTIADKLAAISPPPSAAQTDRQYKLLDDAVALVELRYAAPPVAKPVAREATAPLAPVPPKPVRDPLEDFLASVDETIASPVAPTRPLPESFKRIETPPPAIIKPVAAPPPDPVLGMPSHMPADMPDAEMALPKQSGTGLKGAIYGLLGLAAIGGAGYAGYLYKDQLQAFLGMTQTTPAAPADDAAKPAAAAPAQEPAKPAAAEPAAAAAPQKFTQRLTPEGQEIDTGPGAKPADVGEGQTVATATTPSTAPAAADPAKPAETIAVGQKAIFYEEKTGTEAGTAEQGAVVWSVVQDSPGLDQPEEPAIRGELTIPGRNIKMRLTIKRNGDKSLPASHIVEMLFSTPADFPGGAIETVQRMALKDTEQAPGSPLVGVPAAFGDGFFLIALTDEKTAIDTNLTLLQRQNWVDVPVAYRSGRRALLSFEKGLAGDKVFQEVFKAWEAKGAAPAAPTPAPAATGG
ncbi:MAG: hypothetical protein WCC66_10610 [Rhizobiaceae bacterium]